MRIGLIAPPWVPVPPTGYGGTEVVIDNLARGLTDLGHDVVLFTIGSSTCPVRRLSSLDAPPEIMGTSVEEAAHVLAAYDALHDVDVVHDHTILGPLLAAGSGKSAAPVVTTHHGTFSADCRRIFSATAEHASIIAISHSQAATAGGVPIAAVIHHGIDLAAQPVGPGDGGYAMFLGRMSPDKGVHRAVRVAHAAGLPIVVAAKMREPAEERYFEQRVLPLLQPDDTVVIEPPPALRNELLGAAVAVLDPICWSEPFGLVLVEGLAAGTPVIAFPNGAAPEIVDHGVTGYLCTDEQEMVTALAGVDRIDRAACRAAVEDRFSMHRMALDHIAVYRSVLAPNGVPRRNGPFWSSRQQRSGIVRISSA